MKNCIRWIGLTVLLIVVNVADAERAMAALHDLERDSWATAWSDIGREYLALAKDATSSEEARMGKSGRWTSGTIRSVARQPHPGGGCATVADASTRRRTETAINHAWRYSGERLHL